MTEKGGELVKAKSRTEPLPAPTLAHRKPSIEDQDLEVSGEHAPDFGVSGIKFRLIKAERVEVTDEEAGEKEVGDNSDDGVWVWNGKDWSVTETPGSAYTRKFVLRLKGSDGKYHYALSCSLNLEEFNRRFAGRRNVTDRRLKPVRKNDYDKFKTFVFEAWRSEALRTNSARLGYAARLA